MKRSFARGRLVPQSLSTDPRLGRLSLRAALLFPLMWINCDDQGRISGDPDEIKYATCPNIDHITKKHIPKLLKELEKQGFLKVYVTSKTRATQMLDWWEEQRLQWAWPSQYPPPPGWQDRLRYKPTPKEIVTDNWIPPSALPGLLPGAPPGKSPLSTPLKRKKKEEKERGRRRGNIPGASRGAPRSKSPPSLTTSALLKNFPKAFGRKPDSRELAYLRDIEKEISAAGATAEQVRDAFKEAAMQNKLHLSYVRAILLNWLGVERNQSP